MVTELCRATTGRAFSSSLRDDTVEELRARYDMTQTAQLEDSLTQVDEEDNVIGSVSKLDGHLKLSGQRVTLPHRAFSLFLFNARNELLLQQRSLKKITFPNLWTNTCCSHPRHTPDEIDLSDGYVGPRRAAIRRASFELGINDLAVEQITCGGKILYYADACDNFAEHELDYILFAKVDSLAPYEINDDEVKAAEWVARTDLDAFIEDRKKRYDEDITPWFRLLKNRKLDTWWRNLEQDNTFPDEADKLERFY